MSIVTIGPEFLGSGTPTAFPKLELLSLASMINLEEWTCDADEEEEEIEGIGRRINNIHLRPHLKTLQIMGCPKLRALPKGLQSASSLVKVVSRDANILKEITNLPAVEELKIVGCRHLERISNLQSLRHLLIRFSCDTLKSVENLNALEYLTLIDWVSESLPECFSRLPHPDGSKLTFESFLLVLDPCL